MMFGEVVDTLGNLAEVPGCFGSWFDRMSNWRFASGKTGENSDHNHLAKL